MISLSISRLSSGPARNKVPAVTGSLSVSDSLLQQTTACAFSNVISPFLRPNQFTRTTDIKVLLRPEEEISAAWHMSHNVSNIFALTV